MDGRRQPDLKRTFRASNPLSSSHRAVGRRKPNLKTRHGRSGHGVPNSAGERDVMSARHLVFDAPAGLENDIVLLLALLQSNDDERRRVRSSRVNLVLTRLQ